jgi:hypothetical protein
LNTLAPLHAVGGLVDLVASASQHQREGRAHVALIVDDEDLAGARLNAVGAVVRSAFAPDCRGFLRRVVLLVIRGRAGGPGQV